MRLYVCIFKCTHAYVNILPTILLDISGCNQICITYFPRNKKRPSARTWFTNEAVKADLRVSAVLSQMIPFQYLVTNRNSCSVLTNRLLNVVSYKYLKYMCETIHFKRHWKLTPSVYFCKKWTPIWVLYSLRKFYEQVFSKNSKWQLLNILQDNKNMFKFN